MAARDNFSMDYRCQECGAAGTIHFSQADGWAWLKGDQSTTVESIPAEFEAVPNKGVENGHDIVCRMCSTQAEKVSRNSANR
jgi:hypothetical protein